MEDRLLDLASNLGIFEYRCIPLLNEVARIAVLKVDRQGTCLQFAWIVCGRVSNLENSLRERLPGDVSGLEKSLEMYIW